MWDRSQLVGLVAPASRPLFFAIVERLSNYRRDAGATKNAFNPIFSPRTISARHLESR